VSKTAIGFITLFVTSELLGLFTGHWFFGLYERSIPAALTATVSLQGTRLVFLFHGAALGLVMFVWALAAAAVVRLAAGRAPR
jgi:hypothetical protein